MVQLLLSLDKVYPDGQDTHVVADPSDQYPSMHGEHTAELPTAEPLSNPQPAAHLSGALLQTVLVLLAPMARGKAV